MIFGGKTENRKKCKAVHAKLLLFIRILISLREMGPSWKTLHGRDVRFESRMHGRRIVGIWGPGGDSKNQVLNTKFAPVAAHNTSLFGTTRVHACEIVSGTAFQGSAQY